MFVDVILPAIICICSLIAFGFLMYHTIKCMHKQVDNTIRLNIKIDDVPDEMGDTFKDIFSNAFAALIERRNK